MKQISFTHFDDLYITHTPIQNPRLSKLFVNRWENRISLHQSQIPSQECSTSKIPINVQENTIILPTRHISPSVNRTLLSTVGWLKLWFTSSGYAIFNDISFALERYSGEYQQVTPFNQVYSTRTEFFNYVVFQKSTYFYVCECVRIFTAAIYSLLALPTTINFSEQAPFRVTSYQRRRSDSRAWVLQHTTEQRAA